MAKIHPSMVPAMTDDLQAFADLQLLASKLDGANGWGCNVNVNVTIGTPTDDIVIPKQLSEGLTNEEVRIILDTLHTAQLRRIKIGQDQIKDRYDIDVQTYDDIHATNDECA